MNILAVHPATTRHITAQEQHIAGLFTDGHGLDYVCEQGVHHGWSRARVLAVVEQRGWELDAAGRLTSLPGPAAVIADALDHPHPAVRAAGQRAARTIDALREILARHQEPGR